MASIGFKEHNINLNQKNKIKTEIASIESSEIGGMMASTHFKLSVS